MSGKTADPVESGLRAARTAAAVALRERAEDVLVLDLRGLAGFTDFFVIATAASERRRRTVMDRVEEELRAAHGQKPRHVEGYPAAGWLLADYVDFVVHVFSPESRGFYQIERLWGDAPRWSPTPPGPAPGPPGATPAVETAEAPDAAGGADPEADAAPAPGDR